MKLARLINLSFRISGLVEECEVEAQDLMDTWEDRSEKWQESERGQEVEMEISEIQDAANELSMAWSNLDEILTR